MKLAIVILNWNGSALLKEFLPTVVECSSNHQVIVADNASTDDSVHWLRENYPDIEVIINDENLGYAGGYNQVIPQIDADVLCLLNSDVSVTNQWCQPILKEFENDASLGAAQPALLDYKNQDRFEYAGASGGFLDQLGYPYCRGRVFDYLEMDHGQYDSQIEIDWASGAALFVRKKAFIEAGGFDEQYFAHQEEVDLCWRLRRLDYKVKVFPDARVFHLGGGTLNSLNPRKTFLNFRNSLLTIVKNDGRSVFWLIILARMILDGVAAVKFLLEFKVKHSYAVLKAHISFYKLLPSFLKKRKLLKTSGMLGIKNKGVTSIILSYYLKGKRQFL
ncbi:glycosyltransferase family 2 protein [Nonlabens agnitus]|uniref:dTDP-Rha--alpha-D-GlcNAc-pyrophosphate polyprenol alpha-3-L-rhamnosyltransferase n=1 Tax=Nonlabens agnitus TaxID=870484 RepID=A0A2S9WTS9_9FLAO|nr:glycosyltransferase family 2 protein [Nonlabens agnitus]PRP66894.1 dTDP-Rha--alpha-D-GlcNAc-pyrophosphate polyprenol alpha-3-L-rhamnosyltransferase [Nonlabens agnitus]